MLRHARKCKAPGSKSSIHGGRGLSTGMPCSEGNYRISICAFFLHLQFFIGYIITALSQAGSAGHPESLFNGAHVEAD